METYKTEVSVRERRRGRKYIWINNGWKPPKFDEKWWTHKKLNELQDKLKRSKRNTYHSQTVKSPMLQF